MWDMIPPNILKATPVDLCHVPLKSEFWSHFHRKKGDELCFHLTCSSLLRRAQKSHTLLFDDEKWAAVANQTQRGANCGPLDTLQTRFLKTGLDWIEMKRGLKRGCEMMVHNV